jgi:hypothetical protein
MVGPPAQMYRINGQPRFAIKRSAPLEYQKFWLGHELGHYVFERAGYVGEDIESVCDAFGAAVMAPRPAVLRLHQQFGLDFRKIADAVRATQTWAALRIGEVLRRPLAAVSPGAVRVRGPEAWVWPDESTLRRWASGRSRPGLAKVRLTDQPRRVALLGDEDASETG